MKLLEGCIILLLCLRISFGQEIETTLTNGFCFVDEIDGNSTDASCGGVGNPCVLISTCLNQLASCCSGSVATIFLQSNITASAGNLNITIDESYNFTAVAISGVVTGNTQWNLEQKGFAFSVHKNSSFDFSIDLVTIISSSASALQLYGNSLFFNVYLTHINFIECYSQEGSAIYADFSGGMLLYDVEVSDSSAYKCGGISIHGNDRAFVSIRVGSKLSFVATRSETIGGCMCLFMDPNASFVSIYTPSNVGMISAIGCNAGTDGLIYINGGSAILSNIYATNSAAGDGGVIFAENMNTLIVDSGFATNIITSGSGTVMNIKNSANVNVTALSIQSCTANTDGASGSIYLDSTSNVFLTRMSFLQNAVTSYGGGIYLTNTDNVLVTNSEFTSNDATYGASFACANNSTNTEVIDVTMSGGIAQSYPVEVWSDGSCSSVFWKAPTSCPNNTCDNCSGQVCADNVLSCQCFCSGSPDYSCPSSSPSPSPVSFSPSISPSITPSISQSAAAKSSHTELLIVIVILVATIVVLLGLAYGAHYWYFHRNRNFQAQYQNIN